MFIVYAKVIKKYFLIGLGTLAMVLGLIGVFVPVLPTTPFILLASFCYLRSSRRLYDWIVNHKIFGKYIYNYITHRAVKRSVKISALIMLWTSLSVTMIFVGSFYLNIFLMLTGIAVSVHLLKLKTLKQ